MRCILSNLLKPILPRFLKRANSTSDATSSSIVLRPYQESCLQACCDALNSGITRVGVSLPTGAGKTTVFISLLSRICPPAHRPDATRSLIIVSSVELARQAAARAEALFPQWQVEIEQGARHKASGMADVTVATYQTLLQPTRLEKFHPKSLKAIIVDEAHHAASPSYRRILSHFDDAIKNPDAKFESLAPSNSIPIVGFSATFSRHDGLALGSVFQRIVYHRDFLEMIREQWLCNVRFTSVRANIDLRNVNINSRTGDFNATSLAHIVNTTAVNKLVVQAWLDRASQRKSTLVFCVNLAHVRALTRTFRDFGVDARYVYSGTPLGEREVLIAQFKSGEYPVLVNCAILTEGADIPNIDCVVVARPTRSRNVFAQMIGRGMRLSPATGKSDCHIIDFVDSTGRVAGVVSTPSLFGLDPSDVIEDETIESLEARAASAEVENKLAPCSQSDSQDPIPDPISITYIDYEDPFSLVDNASGAPHIAKMSPNAWVGCGDDVYVLECIGKGYLRIQAMTPDDSDPARFAAFFVPAMLHQPTAAKLNVSPFMRSRAVLTAETLSDAVRGCDTYASQKLLRGRLSLSLLRTASWRKAPASDGQKSFIRKRLEKRAQFMGLAPDQLQQMTKGNACNIIARLKHGAQMRYERKMKGERKIARAEMKEARRRAREVVEVGPLMDTDSQSDIRLLK